MSIDGFHASGKTVIDGWMDVFVFVFLKTLRWMDGWMGWMGWMDAARE